MKGTLPTIQACGFASVISRTKNSCRRSLENKIEIYIFRVNNFANFSLRQRVRYNKRDHLASIPLLLVSRRGSGWRHLRKRSLRVTKLDTLSKRGK